MASTSYRPISRRRRVLVENLTAYAFLLPAGVLIFLFGLFPVAFAFFVSLYRWRRFPDEYVGLSNYERALGDFSHVMFFWLSLAALLYGGWLLWRLLRQIATTPGQRSGLLHLIPAIVLAATPLLLVRWGGLLLPVIMNIPRRLRGQQETQGLFVNELLASFRFPEVLDAGNMMLGVALLALLLAWLFTRSLKNAGLMWRAAGALLALGTGALLMQLTLDTINTAITSAREAGETLPIWTQIILISAGFGLLGAAYWLWGRALRQPGDRRFVGLALVALTGVVGAYLLIAELPRVLANADRDMLTGFNITVMYALFTVPFQLAIGLGLAYLLFQNLKGKTIFRMIFFLPYIMPFIATSIVFSLLFSHRQDSIINHLVGAVGIQPQKWLLEPLGVGRLILGETVPPFLTGPSLALIVVIVYTVWTYAGYATVVFLAGLGNIPGELYEAARIDGAGGWQIFRRLTLPLLSPTTFFLVLVAVIGTFQAFTQLWIMRTPAAGRSIDTVSIYIFRQITDADPSYSYGAALAFVLFGVILLLTFVQNRIAGRRVFYG
jgi:multiple sugar transport system permease protein